MKSKAKVRRPRKRPVAKGRWLSEVEFSRLKSSLAEAQETLNAIRGGEVDAVVVDGPAGHHIYSLTGAEQPYRVFVERMQEGAATISREGLVLFANQRFADMVGQPLERVISASAPSYLGAAAWQAIANVFESQEEVVKSETLLPRAEGAALPVQLTASHLPFLGQNVVCLVVTDLTAQKQSEALRLAIEVAEKANATKDTFLAALSHELRTPLNPALMLASAAADNPELPERFRADFAAICSNIELEARLIDDLLDLTRITHGKLALETQLVDTHVILHQAISTIQSDLNQKQIALSLDLHAQPCRVIADSVRLQQVFWNVLKNAVKFTPEYGRINIATRPALDEKKLHVTVSDTGIGMTSEELKHAFETFAQGEHANTGDLHRFGGLGLGLSISRVIVNLHAGDIHAFSEGRGCGSKFVVELPLAPVSTEAAADSQSPVAPARNASPTPSFSILLVEDHEPTRSALTRLLVRRRHTVAAAATASEARALAKANKFQVVISDIGLPDENGLDLMKELNGCYQLKGIALTGYGMEHDVASSRQSGFLGHLTKPVRIESLEAALTAAMSAPFEPVIPVRPAGKTDHEP